MLLELPSGIWGQARSIQVESAESKEIVPHLVSSSNADYYRRGLYGVPSEPALRTVFGQRDAVPMCRLPQAAVQAVQVDFMYAMPGPFHYGHPSPPTASLSRH